MILGVEKLNAVRRHQRRVCLRCELRREQGLLVGLGGVDALHFEVKTVVKRRAPALQGFCGVVVLALEQQLADFAILRTRERDQPVVGLVQQPFGTDLRVVALIVYHVRTGNQVT